MSMYGGVGLQDAISYEGSGVVLFHDFALCVMVFILCVVVAMFWSISAGGTSVVGGYSGSNYVEIIWTTLPIVVLLGLSFPSLALMYLSEGPQGGSPDLTFKAIGHQWYWSYEGGDFLDFSVDSYMMPLSELGGGDFRLLEVDNSLVLPFGSKIRLVTSSTDVIHCWALPSLALKVDCVPGRLNTLQVGSTVPGSFFGQCSEICGINHSFMPIHVEFVDWDSFLTYVAQ
uniref:Cytochrome c oxidase subunit 2 n=1 Tax=Phallusia mammillata TaxID=59560 RepID=A7WL59_9ASCI|nr:cytochrome c oxidase subunit II [Phallusia mammillata]CAL23072.2 cytochrome c oxidase subunit II [Phallusia mammillata]